MSEERSEPSVSAGLPVKAHEVLPAKRGLRKIPLRLHRRSATARIGIILFDILALCVVLFGIAVFALSGKELPAPDWVAERVETQLAEGLSGATIEIGQVTVAFEWLSPPQIAFRDVHLRAESGGDILQVPVLAVKLEKAALVRGDIRPRSLSVSGASLVIRRLENGQFDFGFGGDGTTRAPGSLAEVLDSIDQAFAQPGLEPIRLITADALAVTFADARAGREWTIEDGNLALEQDAQTVEIRALLRLPGDEPQDDRAEVEMTFSSRKGSTAASLAAKVTNVRARDIAAQSPALAWLAPLRAPVSGALRAAVEEDGKLGEVAGLLDIGQGAFRPSDAVKPAAFESARTYFRYDPDRARISFDDLQLRADDASGTATGHAYIEGLDQGWPTGLVAQLQLADLVFAPQDLLAQAATFASGAVDLRVTLDPFAVTVGQVALTTGDETDEGQTRLLADGRAQVRPDGWHWAADLEVDRIEAQRVLDLWPLKIAPRTREWLLENLNGGLVHDGTIALRGKPNEKPDVSISYQFDGASARVMKTLPPLEKAKGYGAIRDKSFTLRLAGGEMTAPSGDVIDAAGTVFQVPELGSKPAMADLRLRTESTITGALSLLDLEPFRVMSRAGQPVDIAQGRVRTEGVVQFPLVEKVATDQVDYTISGVLTDVRSDRLVPERVLDVPQLSLRATPAEVTLEGNGTLSGIPVQARWIQPLGSPEIAATSAVEGTIEVSQAFIDRFNIGLPDGMISGAGLGQFRIDLAKGAAPRFTMSSDLNRVGMRIAELGWSMGKAAKGSLRVSGQMSDPPVLESIALNAPGLLAEGSVTLKSGGGLDAARFSRVRAGEWIDAPVTLRGRGKGAAPAVEVNGGRIDIRKTSFAQGNKGSTAGGPIQIALDRLVVSEGITLRKFRANLNQSGGLNGRFTGTVNGAAAITGELTPGRQGGTAVRLTSDNAGRVFRAAGLFDKGTGGRMELVLNPRPEPGQYNGTLRVRNTRVQSAPGLAAILNTISVIGLLDQLNGPGLLFAKVDADFRLTPNYVELRNAVGTGPSIGLTMEGVYDMARDRMDMQGVLSPLYVLNAVGQLVSRRGEGLFGFNFRMTGPAGAPKVSVNPLSVLTPGAFREIFRRKAPKLEN